MTLLFSIIVAILGFAFASLVYRDHANGTAPKWLTIPVMTIAVILSIASLVSGIMSTIT